MAFGDIHTYAQIVTQDGARRSCRIPSAIPIEIIGNRILRMAHLVGIPVVRVEVFEAIEGDTAERSGRIPKGGHGEGESSTRKS